jgi:hypothetical protein
MGVLARIVQAHIAIRLRAHHFGRTVLANFLTDAAGAVLYAGIFPKGTYAAGVAVVAQGSVVVSEFLNKDNAAARSFAYFICRTGSRRAAFVVSEFLDKDKAATRPSANLVGCAGSRRTALVVSEYGNSLRGRMSTAGAFASKGLNARSRASRGCRYCSAIHIVSGRGDCDSL